MINLSLKQMQALEKKTKQAKKSAQALELKLLVEAHLSELPEHETEYKFFPTRRWRFDYAWPELKIALEVHGGVYSNGRHTRGVGFTKDREKMNTAQLEGWTVLEVTTEHVKSCQMLDWLKQVFKYRGINASN